MSEGATKTRMAEPFAAPAGNESESYVDVPIDEGGRRVCVVRVYCPEPADVSVRVYPAKPPHRYMRPRPSK